MSKPDLTSWVAYGSSGSLTVFGFALSDIAAVVGIVLGVGTFVVNCITRDWSGRTAYSL